MTQSVETTQNDGSIDFSKRILSFEVDGRTHHYTFDLLKKEKVDWLKDICRALHLGVLSKFFVKPVLFLFTDNIMCQ